MKLEIKTNFEYLKKVINENYWNVDSDVSRYLRDLDFFLTDVEKKIYERDYVVAAYPLRMAWDLSKDFIVYIINNSEAPTFKEWKRNLDNAIKRRRAAAEYKNQHYNHINPGYLSLWNLYPSHVDINIEGVGNLKQTIEIFKEMNSWMHYRYDTNHKDSNTATNVNDKSTLYRHRGDIRYKVPTLFELKRYLESLWAVVAKVMVDSKMFDQFAEYKYDFDSTIYNNPSLAFERLYENRHIDDLLSGRKRCPICREGRFSKPDLENSKEHWERRYKFGAFLTCDTEKCWAKVDSTLKVKKDLKHGEEMESDCPECYAKGSLQKRFSLKNPEHGYYTACNKCSYNDRNQKANINIDDIVDDALENMHFDFYDDQDW